MQNTSAFRCPFEEGGVREDTIINVRLSDDKTERLWQMVKALLQLHSRHESPAIRFVLPSSVLTACKDIRALKMGLLPYQSELIAAQFDHRLRPLLTYYKTGESWVEKSVEDVIAKDKKRLAAASVLLLKFKEFGIRPPRSIVEQSEWIEAFFRVEMHKGLRNPAEEMRLPMTGQDPLPIIRMSPDSLMFHFDREDVSDPVTNRNCLSIVKCPFYPSDFGRYSNDVEIVVSREAEFAKLSRDFRRKIRFRANTVHRAHGVDIQDLEADVQPLGLWIPSEDKGPHTE